MIRSNEQAISRETLLPCVSRVSKKCRDSAEQAQPHNRARAFGEIRLDVTAPTSRSEFEAHNLELLRSILPERTRESVVAESVGRASAYVRADRPPRDPAGLREPTRVRDKFKPMLIHHSSGTSSLCAKRATTRRTLLRSLSSPESMASLISRSLRAVGGLTGCGVGASVETNVSTSGCDARGSYCGGGDARRALLDLLGGEAGCRRK